MGISERRNELIEYLKRHRSDTMSNLAFEFGVSVRTIQRDLDFLSCSYCITTVRGRYGGGVRLEHEQQSCRAFLTEPQQRLLERLSEGLQGYEAQLMQEILQTFAQ